MILEAPWSRIDFLVKEVKGQGHSAPQHHCTLLTFIRWLDHMLLFMRPDSY